MNQNPEQLARDKIDEQLLASGWVIQNKKEFNLAAAPGIAIREYGTTVGPADYILFVNKKPVGLIEAKREEEGVPLTTHEEQSVDHAKVKLKRQYNELLSFFLDNTQNKNLQEILRVVSTPLGWQANPPTIKHIV